MNAGRLVGVIALAVCVLAAKAQETGQPPGRVDPCRGSSADWCLEREEPAPGGQPAGTPGRGGPSPGEPACGWVTVPAEVVPPPTSSRPMILTNGRPPEGTQVVWQGWCYETDGEVPQDFRGPFRWLPADDPALTLTLDQVAAAAYARLEGRMPDPVVVTNPPAGVDAVVDVPVFLSVSNWQPELVETGDLLGDVVTVRASPVVLFESGETAGTVTTCEGPGRTYDRAGGDLWAQARSPGACTYSYRLRTGAEGRPDNWPSVVTVRWSIEWASESGVTGSFPSVDRSVALPRGVDEVQAVVVGGGS